MRKSTISGGIITLITVMFTAGLIWAMSHKAPELPRDLDDYEHVNTLFVPDADSPIHGIHHFSMGKTGRKTFMQGGTNQYPDGTTIVGRVYKPVKTKNGRYKEGDLAAYTLMKKDANNKSTRDTGGWFFVMYDAEGKNKGVDPVKSCFGCHKPSPDTDFVLSTPLQK